MSKSAHTEQPMMTNVKGYFNPNPYRVNVAISEVGMTIQLGPQEFILERASSRKINDPILDRYVGSKMLSPELSDKPIPVIRIPVVTGPRPVSPGYVVGQGVKDKTGKWVPPTAAAGPAPEPEVSPTGAPVVMTNGAITGMSMEAARRLGFVGKQRILSEDYGAVETDGAPTRGDAIPKMKYSMETVAPRAKPGALPKELLEGVRPELAPVLQNMALAAQADPETANLSRQAAEKATREQLGETGVKAFRQTAKQIKTAAKSAVATVVKAVKPAQVAAPVPAEPVDEPLTPLVAAPVAPAPVKSSPRQRIAQVLPAPPVDELAETEDDSPITGGRPATDLPPPVLEESGEKTEPKEAFKCAACGKEFPFKSYYVRHIGRAHKNRLAELMPPTT